MRHGEQATDLEPVAGEARDKILDAAEAGFAAKGFDGIGMKAIAIAAGVAQGLLHYHFGSKEGLYEAVVKRRAQAINAAREAALEAIDTTQPDSIYLVFRAFFAPPLGAEGGGGTYARIFANLASGTDRNKELVRKYYDPTARKFLAAIMSAEPGVDLEAASWSYTLAVGALVSVVSRDDRRERLSGQTSDGTPASAEETVRHLVVNAVGGLRLLAKENSSITKG